MTDTSTPTDDAIPASSGPPPQGSTPEELVGEPDGTITNGEKIVYEYDDAGAFVGWHKKEVTA